MKLRKVDVGTYKGLAYLVQMGTVMVLPIIAGIAGGAWLDERFHTGSRFMIVGAILGTITAFMQLFKIGMKLARVKPPAPPEAPDTLETLEALRQKRDSLRQGLQCF